jgi:molecular chaperone HtpG
VRDLLPRWAGFISGVVTSPALTPTASREDLQRDDAWEAAAEAIHRSLLSGLKRIARTEPDAWRRILARHNEALLGAAVADEALMELLRDELTVPTSEGDVPVRAVLKRSQQRAYVSLASHGGFEEMLFRALKVPVITGTRFGALAFVQAYPGAQVVMLGTSEGDRHVFAAVPLPDADRAFLQTHLVPAHAELVTARFKPPSLPLVLVPDRDAELKRRLDDDAASRRISQAALGLARLFTAQVQGPQARLYVNVDNPAVKALLACRASGKDPVPAARLLRALGSLMSGGGESGSQVDLSATLEDYTAAVVALLGGG